MGKNDDDNFFGGFFFFSYDERKKKLLCGASLACVVLVVVSAVGRSAFFLLFGVYPSIALLYPWCVVTVNRLFHCLPDRPKSETSLLLPS